MIIEQVESHLKAEALKEVGKPRDVFRASGSGRCTREQAYQMLGVVGEPLTPRRLMVFAQGRWIEGQLTDLMKASLGARFVPEGELGDHFFDLDGIHISYHIDGMFEYDDVNGKQCGIIEFKSINTRGFEKIVTGQIDIQYLCQAWCYLHGTQFPLIVFIFYRKDTSHLCEVIFDRNAKELVVTQRLGGDVLALAKDDPLLVTEVRSPFDESVGNKVREHFKWLAQMHDTYEASGVSIEEYENDGMMPPGVRAVEDEIISVQGLEKATAMLQSMPKGAHYEKSGSWYKFNTGRKILGFPCSYCAYKQQCFPDAQLEINRGAPKWVVDRESKGD